MGAGAIATFVDVEATEPSGDHPKVGEDDRAPSTSDTGRRRGLLRPGWPLAAIFVPFPLWWVLGLQEWIFLILTVPMALYLVRRHEVLVPKGFGFWLLFLLWVGGGVLVLQVDAYGAVADDSTTRIITWGYRLLWYLAVTIVGLYVINTRDEVSTTRIARIMSAMFLTIVAGGILGLVAPRFEFASVMEQLLPNSLASQQFVVKMIHPTAAQLMDVLGYESPRPSAPFFFTNTWGLNIAVFLPFFLMGWTGKDAGWRRALSPVVLVLAAVAIIMSINRGLWLAVVAMALFMAVRAAFMGRPGTLALVFVAGGMVAGLIAFTSLGDVVQTRITSQGSEQGRTNLGTLAVTSVTRTAPISGLGSTRNVQGNFNTIAGGATAECPRCSPPALGTQGQLWLVVYSQGWVGLAFYLTFFVLVFLRYLRHRTPEANLGLAVLVACAVTMPFYNALGSGLMAVMVAIGLMARTGAAPLRQGPHYAGVGDRSLKDFDGYLRPLAAYWGLVALCVVLGLVGGYAWQEGFGASTKATATIALPEQPLYQDSVVGQRNIDTLAQYLGSDAVLKATAAAARAPEGAVRERLQLVAEPNTRVVRISYIDPDPILARAAAQAAADELVAQRAAALEYARTTQLAILGTRAKALDQSLRTLDNVLVLVQGGLKPTKRAPLTATAALRKHKAELITEVSAADNQLARVLGANLVAGTQVNEVAIQRNEDPRVIALLTGGLLGVLGGAGLATVLFSRRRQIHLGSHVLLDTGLPVLSSPDAPRRRWRPSRDRRASARAVSAASPLARSWPGVTFLAVSGNDPRSVEVARELNRLAPALGTSRPQVVIVSNRHTRVAELIGARDRCQRWGSHVAGVVIV